MIVEFPRRQLLEKILNTLESQRFNNFYNEGSFDSYIRRNDQCPKKEEILEEIAKIFNV